MLGEIRKVRIKGITDILGSVTADKEVYSKFIASKAETQEEVYNAKGDKDDLPDIDGKETVFYRGEDGFPVLKGYQIKGFLKEAAKAMRGTLDEVGSVTTSQGKVDNLIFVKERDIKLYRDGKRIEDIDGYLERPLRAQTMQGPRVSLARSEVIKEGWECEFTLQFINDVHGGRSKTYTWDTIEKLLEYGSLKGLLQWRNAGYGAFSFEWVEDKKEGK